MIETYKFIHGIYDTGNSNLIKMWEECSFRHSGRKNHLQIFPQHSRLNTRKNYFTIRIAKTWNNLPENIVTAGWIEEWLLGRKQRVVLNGVTSRQQDVLSGVPQGSVLGPTLFLIFVNDIDNTIASHIQKFADDCKVYRSVSSTTDIELLQQDIKNLCKWSKDWQVVFSVKKCKSLHIGNNNIHHEYTMESELLQQVTEETDLGVIISQDLKPSKQCVNAVKKANMTLGMMKRHIV